MRADDKQIGPHTRRLRQDFSRSAAFADHGLNRDTGRALGRRKCLRVGEEPVATHRSQDHRFEDHRRRTNSCNRDWREDMENCDRGLGTIAQSRPRGRAHAASARRSRLGRGCDRISIIIASVVVDAARRFTSARVALSSLDAMTASDVPSLEAARLQICLPMPSRRVPSLQPSGPPHSAGRPTYRPALRHENGRT